MVSETSAILYEAHFLKTALERHKEHLIASEKQINKNSSFKVQYCLDYKTLLVDFLRIPYSP